MRRQHGVLAVLAIALLGMAHARGPPVEGPADACQACLISVRILEDVLCDPEATDFLVDFVEKKICPSMGDKAQCHNLAEGLLPTVVQWFRASATPASLCSAVGVCGAGVLQIAPLNKPAVRAHNSAECALCEYVVRTVQQKLKDTQALEKIKEVALKVCTELPGEVKASCTVFVDKYAPMITNMVETLDPETVCELLGQCMLALAAVPPPPLPAVVMQAIADSQIFRRPPPPPVLTSLMGFPPSLFGPPGGPGMMAHYGLGNGPHHDGSSGSWWMMTMHPHGPMDGPWLNDACEYCKMAVIEAHSLVSNPTVQAEVVNYTLAICENFPSFSEPCKMYVQMYAPLVLTLLEQYLVPDAVCAQTGLCPPSDSMSDLPAYEKRSWKCWLLDGWLGSVLRHLGLDGLMTHHGDMHGLEHDDDDRMQIEPHRLMQ